MREWLKSLQKAVDKALTEKKIDYVTGNILSPLSEAAAIGRRLLCSVGQNYNCTERVIFFYDKFYLTKLII